jgi:uncharacterized membrane protein YeiB
VSARTPSLDVARALALIGVVVMNYHAYLNPKSAYFQVSPSVWDRLFNPLSGILTSRFAAAFVVIAGIGVSLMTNKARESNDAAAMRNYRLVLFRRGLLLYVIGYGLQWIWPGTILFYYGAYFMLAAFIVAQRTRALIVIAAVCVASAAALSVWRANEMLAGNPTAWLSPNPNTPRNLMIRTFLDYTHPIFPWFAFFCAGLILGRSWSRFSLFRQQLLAISFAVLVIAHGLRALLTPKNPTTTAQFLRKTLVSTQPFDRGALYVIGTLATVLCALVCVVWITDGVSTQRLTQSLARAGQMSLSIYLAHIAFFNLIVNRLHWVRSTGLDTTLALSIAFYLVALSMGSWWVSRYGRGPAERAYRFFGG